MAAVRKGNVADSELVELSQRRERIPELVATLNSYQTGDLLLCNRSSDIMTSEGEAEIL